MTKNKERLPYKISDYITEHFREDFLFEVKEVRQIEDQTLYTIEVAKDDYIHTLIFDEDGHLIQDHADEAFPPDTRDEAGFSDVPD
jgi:hypothetical protein